MKTMSIKKGTRQVRKTTVDPKARLDAWERARGALSKKRMKEVLLDMRIARKEWDLAGR